MCGIAGVLKRNGSDARGLVREMTGMLKHRGPDGEGFYGDDHVELAMRRLAIIDIQHGQQPLFNETGDVVVVFNGEIYNHESFRPALTRQGHRLTSSTDGAILPHLFEEFGPDFIDQLNGIFALAVWDARRRTLYLARDRCGVKPLYWARAGGNTIFCSEIRGLMANPAVSREVDLEAIDNFLSFRFVPAPQTLLRSVRKVRPGAILSVTPEGEHERQYWTGHMSADRHDTPALIDEYADLLEAAVLRQMMSDRPIGVMLSGGVDSAVITAIMARHSSKVRTFTVGFEGGGSDNDETGLAAETARMFDTEHEALVVATSDYLSKLPDSYAMLEEPVGSSSALAVNYVARMMKAAVPVALCGQGADELLGGYWRYIGAKLAPLLGPAAGPVARILEVLPTGGTGVRVGRGIATMGAAGDLNRLMAAYSLLDNAQRVHLYRPWVAEHLHGHSPSETVERLRQQVAGLPLLDQMLFVDTRLWLPNELLLIADKMSMAASVELRVPFLDPDLVAFAESVSGSLKVHGLTRKYLHKKAVTRWVPRTIAHRKERGWSTPMGGWLSGDLRPLLRDTLLADGGLCQTLFETAAMEQLMREHWEGHQDHTRQLFALLGLGLWHEHFASARSPLPRAGDRA